MPKLSSTHRAVLVCLLQRKAGYLKRTATILNDQYNSDIPDTIKNLVSSQYSTRNYGCHEGKPASVNAPAFIRKYSGTSK